MRILNLYSGIGGNRKFWDNRHQVTSIEYDPKIAEVYSGLYPQDEVVVGDASQYLIDNYKSFDFIWASPPYPTHSQYRHNVGVLGKGFTPVMPDMTSLYGLIVFLKTYHTGFYCVENVKPYYHPLITPSIELQRHLLWSNFNISYKDFKKAKIRSKNKISDFEDGELVSKSSIKNKRQVLRNCVNSSLGKHVLDCLESFKGSKQ